MTLQQDIEAIVQQVQIHGEFVAAGPYGSGHINDT